eukprot:scaffold671623_cov75-Prasinocladus_malaysianus.AAC.1
MEKKFGDDSDSCQHWMLLGQAYPVDGHATLVPVDDVLGEADLPPQHQRGDRALPAGPPGSATHPPH